MRRHVVFWERILSMGRDQRQFTQWTKVGGRGDLSSGLHSEYILAQPP